MAQGEADPGSADSEQPCLVNNQAAPSGPPAVARQLCRAYGAGPQPAGETAIRPGDPASGDPCVHWTEDCAQVGPVPCQRSGSHDQDSVAEVVARVSDTDAMTAPSTCRTDRAGWAGAHRHGAVRPRQRVNRRERPPRRWC
ncbi:hypothetical protein GCM10027290_45650 [Micromonospora sonneratiae]|jgi:hypothetical protein|uniref:Uncharacterized protein n=1 Tax=Micromonospora sonneratiae TaxID=1184706 RepID=A0ABW3YMG4_9ACTN